MFIISDIRTNPYHEVYSGSGPTIGCALARYLKASNEGRKPLSTADRLELAVVLGMAVAQALEDVDEEEFALRLVLRSARDIQLVYETEE